MSTIRKATEKARLEREQRAARSHDASPMLRSLQVEPRDEPDPSAGERGASPGEPDPGEDGLLPVLEGSFGPPDEHLVCLLAPESVESEHYQSIRHTLEQRRQADGLCVIGVSSAAAHEGKTLTTLNLAGCLARDENLRVLVLEADLRKPSVGKFLRMKSPGIGLNGALVREDRTLFHVARHYRKYNLTIVPGGGVSSVPYEVLTSSRIRLFLQDARRHFDYVFVDLPPMLFPECRALEEHLDGLVFVVTAHKTSRIQLKDAMESVDPSKILGVIFNQDSQRRSRISSYYRYGRA